MLIDSNRETIATLTAFAVLSTAGLSTATPAHSSDWGCEVALCLSNPAGPMAVTECVPPISKLWRHLRKGRSFPRCEADTSVFRFIDRGYEPYYPCTDGRQLVSLNEGDLPSPSGGPMICRKVMSPEEYFGNGTKSQANLDPGDEIIYQENDGGVLAGQRIIAVHDNETAVRREKPNFVTYWISGEGNRKIWY